jgi:hypothetical protein
MENKNILLDSWQREVLEFKGNKIICSGRQTGKSTVASQLASDFAINNPKKFVLIISVTEDQAKELLMKCLLYIEDNYKGRIKTGIHRPTKDKLQLKNGSVIRTKAVGMSGVGVRGFTIDMLIADEAAFMPEDVWPAVTPMLLTTGGDIVLISTPFGRKNFFYKCYSDPQFRVWHIDTLDTIEKRTVCPTWTQFQRDKALEYFKSEQHRLSEKEFQQEYRGMFVEDLSQFYPDDFLKKSLIQQKVDYGKGPEQEFVIGVDIGRMGGDKTVFAIFERRGELLIQRENIVWNEAKLDQVANYIIDLDATFHFSRIYLDSGGIGIGVFDILYNTPNLKKRVKGINNAEKIIEYDSNGKEKKAKFMKEEIYANLYFLMAKGKIVLFDQGDIWLSLKSAEYEYVNQRGGAMMKISHIDHRQSHICEAIVRAAMISKEKINKLWISYI